MARQVGDQVALSPGQADPFATIDACVAAEMAREGAPGAAIAVIEDGRLVYEKGYGVKNAIHGGEVGPATQFRIGAITEMLTAAAVMQQVEISEMDLQAPITRYVPELRLADPEAADAITLWNLLTHTSGLPDDAVITPGDLDGPRDDFALTDWVPSLIDTQLHAPPGSFWNHGNPNYMLAGLAAERASGVPYHQLMAERLFATAGLTATSLLPSDVMARGDYADGHWTNLASGTREILAPDTYDNWAVAPAGYAFSTAGDLARWALLLTDGGGDVLAPASAADMQARQQTLNLMPGFDFGLGIFRQPYKDLDVAQHGGGIPGWGAYLLWVPSARFAVAALFNAYPAQPDASAFCAVDAILEPDDEPPPDYTTPPATWLRYAGDYGGRVVSSPFWGDWALGGDYWDGRVFGQDGKLYLTLQDPALTPAAQHTSELQQAYLDTFQVDLSGDGQLDDAVTFIQDPDHPDRWWLRHRHFVLQRPPPASPYPTPTAEATEAPLPMAVHLPWLSRPR